MTALLDRLTRPAREALTGGWCWWCAHPEPHTDDGCRRPGCPCTELA